MIQEDKYVLEYPKTELIRTLPSAGSMELFWKVTPTTPLTLGVYSVP